MGTPIAVIIRLTTDQVARDLVGHDRLHLVHVFQHGAVLLPRDPCRDGQVSAWLHSPRYATMPAVAERCAQSCVEPRSPAVRTCGLRLDEGIHLSAITEGQ